MLELSKKYDLLGKLIVIGREHNAKGTPWVCQCDCGNKKLVTSHYLLIGDVSSCGCLRSEVRIKDLSGQRFVRLMINVNYNAQTGETTYEDVADIEMPKEIIFAEPTEAERIKALEDTMIAVILGGATNG